MQNNYNANATTNRGDLSDSPLVSRSPPQMNHDRRGPARKSITLSRLHNVGNEIRLSQDYGDSPPGMGSGSSGGTSATASPLSSRGWSPRGLQGSPLRHGRASPRAVDIVRCAREELEASMNGTNTNRSNTAQAQHSIHTELPPLPKSTMTTLAAIRSETSVMRRRVLSAPTSQDLKTVHDHSNDSDEREEASKSTFQESDRFKVATEKKVTVIASSSGRNVDREEDDVLSVKAFNRNKGINQKPRRRSVSAGCQYGNQNGLGGKVPSTCEWVRRPVPPVIPHHLENQHHERLSTHQNAHSRRYNTADEDDNDDGIATDQSHPKVYSKLRGSATEIISNNDIHKNGIQNPLTNPESVAHDDVSRNEDGRHNNIDVSLSTKNEIELDSEIDVGHYPNPKSKTRRRSFTDKLREAASQVSQLGKADGAQESRDGANLGDVLQAVKEDASSHKELSISDREKADPVVAMAVAASQRIEARRKSLRVEDEASDDDFGDGHLPDHNRILKCNQPMGVSGDIDWSRGELLGEGAYGKVYIGLNLRTGELMAVKCLNLYSESKRREAQKHRLEELEREISIYRRLRHEHIVSYYGAAKSDIEGVMYIFLEYISGGCIASMLHRFGRFNVELVQLYIRQILLGLEYLHREKIIHRDIKGANILIAKDGTAKLADFGASKAFPENTVTDANKSLHGSIYWMAPEVVTSAGYGRRADVWSIGCTVVEMLTAKHPWPDADNQWSAIFAIARTKTGPPFPDDVSDHAKQFMKHCFQTDPKQRSSVSELLQLPFVANTDRAMKEARTATTLHHSM